MELRFEAPLFFIHRIVLKNMKKVFLKKNSIPKRNLIESQSFFLYPRIERSIDEDIDRWPIEFSLTSLQSL